jgi:bifunctional DNase/RNase
MPVVMSVESIRQNLLAPHRVVVLKEDSGRGRILPIVIGVWESEAIAMHLRKTEVPRPMTHDLLANMIAALGGRVLRILVNDLAGETFFARIILDVDGRHVEVDARPSDAIALAVRVEVPILVDEGVLTKGAIEGEGTRPEQLEAPEEEQTGDRIGDEQLAVFRDIISQLNLDDLGNKGKA